MNIELEDLGNGQAIAHKKRRDDIAYMLSEGLAMAEKVRPSDVLHCLAPAMRNRSSVMSAGTSNADLWIARNGDPMASVDSALRLTNAVGDPMGLKMSVDNKTNHAKAILTFPDGNGVATAETVPLAIILALFNYTQQQEDIDI